MATILLTAGSSVEDDSIPTCPFCSKSGFKRLGHHLPHCPERNGRDYTEFLSKKTLYNKNRANSCKTNFCPKCHKRFYRLDTHLRTSATCKLMVTSDQAFSNLCATSDSSCPFTPATIEPSESCGSQEPQVLSAATILDSVPKPRLRLPVSDDDWKEINTYFEQNLVPYVLGGLSVDAKYTILADGIYNYLAEKYGTCKTQHRHRSRHNKLASRVKETKDLKNAARRELNKAKLEKSISQDQIRI